MQYNVKYFLTIFMIACFAVMAFIFYSCSENPVEQHNSGLTGSRVYSINRVDGGTNFQVRFTSIDSLDKFKEIGFSFRSESMLVFPDHFISQKHRLYVVASLSKLYFIDTQSNKLVKVVEMTYTGEIDFSFVPGEIKFLDYDDDRCILISGNSAYLINLPDKSIERRVFDGNNISFATSIISSALTFDRRFLYLVTETRGISGRPKYLLKVDLLMNKISRIEQLSPNIYSQDTTGIASLGTTSEYLIYLDSTNDYLLGTGRSTYYKYSVRSDKMIEKKTYRALSTNHELYPFGKSKLLSHSIDGGSFHIINVEDFSISDYMQTQSDYLAGIYQKLSDGLYFLATDNRGTAFIFNVTEKKLKYSFPHTTLYKFIIMETL